MKNNADWSNFDYTNFAPVVYHATAEAITKNSARVFGFFFFFINLKSLNVFIFRNSGTNLRHVYVIAGSGKLLPEGFYSHERQSKLIWWTRYLCKGCGEKICLLFANPNYQPLPPKVANYTYIRYRLSRAPPPPHPTPIKITKGVM